MSDLKTALNDAKDLGSKEAFDEAQKKIGKLKAKLKGRPVLSGWKTDIDVPAEGYDDLKLELSELSE